MCTFSLHRRALFFLLPVFLIGLLTLSGCLVSNSGSPAGNAAENTPETAVKQLLSEWKAEGRPIVAQISPQTTTASPSMGVIYFTDLSKNAPWEFDIYEISYISAGYAEVKTKVKPDARIVGSIVKINFMMTMFEGRWQLEDLFVEDLPEMIPLSGTGVGGYIHDSAGNPVQNATVTIYDGETPLAVTTTDASGYYYLQTPAPGTYTVTVVKGDTVILTEMVVVNEIVTLPLIVTTAGIQGFIRDAANLPVQNAAVALYQGTTRVAETLTDANGYYFLAAPAAGSYTLVAAKDGFEFLTVPNVTIN